MRKFSSSKVDYNSKLTIESKPEDMLEITNSRPDTSKKPPKDGNKQAQTIKVNLGEDT